MDKGITRGLNHLRRAHLEIQIRTRRKTKVFPPECMLRCVYFLLRTARLAVTAGFFFRAALLDLA